jgi:integrase
VQLLLLTGTRRTEASEARWSEFDLDAAMWTIPRARFKTNAVHRVSLSPEAIALLQALPRPKGKKEEDFVFSTTRGERPVGDYSGAKAAIDTAMAKRLGATPAPWQLHDLRHTVRTRLSGLKVPEEVAEMVIGHAKKDPRERTYNHYEYKDEMRDALCRWGRHLMGIVDPTAPDNVEELVKRRRA